jgi:hypothetical protein
MAHNFQLNSSMDVWTLGMIILHCVCLEYKKSENEFQTIDELINFYFNKSKSQSLINVEEKIDFEQLLEQ